MYEYVLKCSTCTLSKQDFKGNTIFALFFRIKLNPVYFNFTYEQLKPTYIF